MSTQPHSRSRRAGAIDSRAWGLAPTDRQALMLWYSADSLSLADDAAVTTVPDLSGNGYTGTATGVVFKTGIVNSKPIFRFNGAHRIDFGEIRLQRCIWMLVLSRALGSNNDAIILTPDDGTYAYLQYSTTWYASGSDSQTCDLGTGWKLAECKYDGTNILRYINGTAQTNQVASRAAPMGRLGTANFSCKIDAAEFLIFRDTLSTSLRQSWENYLNTRYALW